MAARPVGVGERFGRLVAIRRRAPGETFVRCRCDCGTEKDIRFLDLGRRTVSCGCYNRERASQTHARHGRSHTRAYWAWRAMIARCTNPRHISYRYYGAKGITVCDRWRDFAAFVEDMGERPPGMSIDRVDNSRGYEPGNCRWATPAEQTANRGPATASA